MRLPPPLRVQEIGRRQRPSEFCHAGVQQRRAHFETDGHAGAVYLGQDVVRQIADVVVERHGAHRVVQLRPCRWVA